MIERRSLIAALLATPFIVRTHGLLMPIKVPKFALSDRALAVCSVFDLDPVNVREMPDGLQVGPSAYWKMADRVSSRMFSSVEAADDVALKGFLAKIDIYNLRLSMELG